MVVPDQSFTTEELAFVSNRAVTNNSFRFNAQTVFLTFPQSNFNLQALYDDIHARFPIAAATICRERHADGEWHIHAAIKFVRKVNARGARTFDFDGRHPHFRSCSNFHAACRYCRKEASGEDLLEIGMDDQPQQRRSPNDVYREAVNTRSFDEARQIILEGAARDYVIYGDKIESRLRSLFQPPPTTYVPEFPRESFVNVPKAANQWAERYLASEFQGRPKSLLLVGPSRLGKTEWARSLGPHIYCSGYYTLEAFEAGGDYVVMDDIPWKNFPNPKGILGGQKTITLTDKYRAKKTFTDWCKPCIVCWNQDMYPIEFSEDVHLGRWTDDNTIKIICTDKFY